jgi:hypothetical protein
MFWFDIVLVVLFVCQEPMVIWSIQNLEIGPHNAWVALMVNQ